MGQKLKPNGIGKEGNTKRTKKAASTTQDPVDRGEPPTPVSNEPPIIHNTAWGKLAFNFSLGPEWDFYLVSHAIPIPIPIPTVRQGFPAIWFHCYRTGPTVR